jgi:hypothetical protein
MPRPASSGAQAIPYLTRRGGRQVFRPLSRHDEVAGTRLPSEARRAERAYLLAGEELGARRRVCAAQNRAAESKGRARPVSTRGVCCGLGFEPCSTPRPLKRKSRAASGGCSGRRSTAAEQPTVGAMCILLRSRLRRGRNLCREARRLERSGALVVVLVLLRAYSHLAGPSSPARAQVDM